MRISDWSSDVCSSDLDQVGDGAHLRLAHALRGDGRGTDAQTRGDVGRTGIVGHRVLVAADARAVEGQARLLSGELLVERSKVDTHEVVFGSAGYKARAHARAPLGPSGGWDSKQ